MDSRRSGARQALQDLKHPSWGCYSWPRIHKRFQLILIPWPGSHLCTSARGFAPLGCLPSTACYCIPVSSPGLSRCGCDGTTQWVGQSPWPERLSATLWVYWAKQDTWFTLLPGPPTTQWLRKSPNFLSSRHQYQHPPYPGHRQLQDRPIPCHFLPK